MKSTLALAALICLLALARPAEAARSYDNCTGFVDSVPAVITTQGTWCLRADLSSALASGNIIQIATNNVTLDCNDFKLGGLAAGPGTLAIGVAITDRLNAVVRNCNIRGFLDGISINGGGGHLVENNRFDGNTVAGIRIVNADGTIRGNFVQDTGGSTTSDSYAYGIIGQNGSVEILDNTIWQVQPLATNGIGAGIYTQGQIKSIIGRNRIREARGNGTGADLGIYAQSAGTTIIHDNVVIGPERASSVGIFCSNNRATASGNLLSGHVAPIIECANAGNYSNPN